MKNWERSVREKERKLLSINKKKSWEFQMANQKLCSNCLQQEFENLIYLQYIEILNLFLFV